MRNNGLISYNMQQMDYLNLMNNMKYSQNNPQDFSDLSNINGINLNINDLNNFIAMKNLQNSSNINNSNNLNISNSFNYLENQLIQAKLRGNYLIIEYKFLILNRFRISPKKCSYKSK